MRLCKLLVPVLLSVFLLSCNNTNTDRAVGDSTEKTVESAVTEPSDAIEVASETAGTVLDYFAEIAFGSEYGDSSDRLCRWEDRILYKVTGNPSDSDTELIEYLTDKLNKIKGFPGIEKAGIGDTANFEIMFITRDEIIKLFDDATDACTGMSEYTWDTESYRIIKARAAIDSDEVEERESTVCEEILQSLGLAMDSYTHKDSVFYQGKCVYRRPSKLDFAMVELLYHPEMKTGMTRHEAIVCAAGILKW